MVEHFEAIFENGVLRPVQALDWPDQQRVSLAVTAIDADDDLGGLIDTEAHSAAHLEADDSITLDEVRRRLAKIPGSMAEFVSAQRDDR
jgi:hypothetical protein